MTILCATDFSNQARAAEEAAAALAERLGEVMWLLHVLEPGTEVLTTEANERLMRSARTELAGATDRLHARTAIKTSS
jgi:hypothetical protein